MEISGDGGHPAERIEHGDGSHEGDGAAVAELGAESEDGFVGEVVVAPGDAVGDGEGDGIRSREAGRDFATGKGLRLARGEGREGGATVGGVGAVEGGDAPSATFEGRRWDGIGIEGGSEEACEAVAEIGEGREEGIELKRDEGFGHARILDQWPKVCPAG